MPTFADQGEMVDPRDLETIEREMVEKKKAIQAMYDENTSYETGFDPVVMAMVEGGVPLLTQYSKICGCTDSLSHLVIILCKRLNLDVKSN